METRFKLLQKVTAILQLLNVCCSMYMKFCVAPRMLVLVFRLISLTVGKTHIHLLSYMYLLMRASSYIAINRNKVKRRQKIFINRCCNAPYVRDKNIFFEIRQKSDAAQDLRKLVFTWSSTTKHQASVKNINISQRERISIKCQVERRWKQINLHLLKVQEDDDITWPGELCVP